MKAATPYNRFLRRAATDKRLLPSHISLYTAMYYFYPLDSSDRFFKVSRRALMRYSHIRSVATYHKCVRELVASGSTDFNIKAK